MERGGKKKEESKKRKNPTTKYTREVRQALARIGGELEQRGWSRPDISQLFSDADYPLPDSTLARYLLHDRQGSTPVADKGGGGRPRSLDQEEAKLLIGWAVKKYVDDQQCTPRDALEFLSNKLNVVCDEETVRNYFRDAGLTPKAMKKKAKKAAMTMDEITDMVRDFIYSERRIGNLRYNQLFATVDFTYTSHRTTRFVSWSPSGLPAPKMAEKMITYTACIVTFLWSDGINRTPALAFVYNDALFLQPKLTENTHRKRANLRHHKSVLEELGLDGKRIIVLEKPPPDEKGSRTFVRESMHLLKNFIEYYWDEFQDKNDLVVYSDNGSALFHRYEKKSPAEPVLEKEYNITQRRLPSAVHEYLSPNDNKFHGIVKAQWRSDPRVYSDDSRAVASFLHLCDQVSKDTVENMFIKNFKLDGGQVTKEDVEDIVATRSGHRVEKWRECLQLYLERYVVESTDQPRAVARLASALDGNKW